MAAVRLWSLKPTDLLTRKRIPQHDEQIYQSYQKGVEQHGRKRKSICMG